MERAPIALPGNEKIAGSVVPHRRHEGVTSTRGGQPSDPVGGPRRQGPPLAGDTDDPPLLLELHEKLDQRVHRGISANSQLGPQPTRREAVMIADVPYYFAG